MAKFELKLPKMGESVAEATLTAWLKDVGDKIDADEPVLEIATDKVDSEVPSEVEGVLIQKLFEVDDVVNKIRAEVDAESEVIIGAITDELLDGKIRVSIVATSLDGQLLFD